MARLDKLNRLARTAERHKAEMESASTGRIRRYHERAMVQAFELFVVEAEIIAKEGFGDGD